MENDKLIEIIAWIKGHKMFKWGLMCDEIGFDRGNFQRIMQSNTPKINPDFIPKMINVLKKYGYVESSVGEVGIIIPQSESGRANEKFKEDAALIVYTPATKKAFDGGERDKKFDDFAMGRDPFKKGKSKAKVTITDLSKPTVKKVVSDPPQKSKETDYLATRRKSKQ